MASIFPGVGEQGDLLRVMKRGRLLEMGGGRRIQEMFVSGSGRPQEDCRSGDTYTLIVSRSQIERETSQHVVSFSPGMLSCQVEAWRV